MPAKHHKQRTIILEAEPIILEAKAESDSYSCSDSSSPVSFLARVKSIVDDISKSNPMVKTVPLALRHRVHEFRPRARAVYLKRKVKLFVPEWNEKSAGRLEKVLGIVLIFIAFFFLKLEESQSLKSSAHQPQEAEFSLETQGLSQGQGPGESLDLDQDLSSIEVPLLAESACDPALLAQLAPQSANHAFSRFHSYADPKQRFNFNNSEAAWKSNYLHSTNAACGMASHFQHSMPVMLRRGTPPAWSRQHDAKTSFRRTCSHPLLKRMQSQIRQQAFQKYVDSARTNIGATPITNVVHQFHSFSHVLKESCGSAPSQSDGSGEGQ